MHTVVATFLLLTATGLHAYTLETRNSPPECMDPNSQPEKWVSSNPCDAFVKPLHLAKATFQVNTECASSLTSPSSCMQRVSYFENCVAYCEQYVYWFFGPEVPFPDSNCEAYEPCTFAGAAVTNGYSFDAGLSAERPSKDLEAAFIVGASYEYSITKTTSQILSVMRPGNFTGNCGYWTFLPYYIQSCGFYISGTEYLTPEVCVGSYCSSDEMRCGTTNYIDIAFGCTNTTYVDSNGDADGVTVFVATDCESNSRLPFTQQDVRYSGVTNYMPILANSELTAGHPSFLVPEREPGSDPPLPISGPAAADPKYIDTCNRGCICGYSPTSNQTFPLDWPIYPAYYFCQCDIWLSNYLHELIDSSPHLDAVLVTAANISLLDHYSVNCTGLITTNYIFDNPPFQSPFECFGDPLTVGTAVFQYVFGKGILLAE